MQQTIIATADKHCPYKKYQHKKELPPWLTQDILDLIHDRDRQYKLAKRSNDSNDWAEARRMRNLCNKGVKNAKNMFIKKELTQNEKDPRKFWKVIEQAWTPCTEKNNHINLKDHVTNEYVDTKDIPNIFNNDLCSIASKLTKKFENYSTPFMETLNRVNEDMIMSQITATEVYDLKKKDRNSQDLCNR